MTNETLKGVTIDVTPEQAAKWLEGKVHTRSVRQSKVAEYTADMKAGRWQLTHQGIAFDEDGALIDGQHRLWAVVESGKTVRMMVTRDVPRTHMLVMDGGLQRSIVDVIRLQSPTVGITSLHVATARAMLEGQKEPGRRYTRTEVERFLSKHWEAVDFAVGLFPKRRAGVTIAPVLATLARASYGQPREPLARFASVLSDGLADPRTESAAVKLRNWLLDVARGHRGAGRMRSGETGPKVFYGKTQRALVAFLRGEDLANLYPASEEMFPLPEEKSRLVRKRGA